MHISMPYLATDPLQFPERNHTFGAVEAIVFDRKALDAENWRILWQLIDRAIAIYSPERVTFHFPVNHSDYVDDVFVRSRLVEAIARCTDREMHGLVVHSNRIRPIGSWMNISIPDERAKVIDCLGNLAACYDVPIFIENMPIMDNYGIEIDPLFVFPNDFIEAVSAGLQVVWDICHYSSTVATVNEVLAGQQSRSHFPNLRECDYLDFLSIGRHIQHWHFSAFNGIANPSTGARCTEGVHPLGSSLGPGPYLRALKAAYGIMRPNTHVVLEVREDDYSHRRNFDRLRDWIMSALATSANSICAE